MTTRKRIRSTSPASVGGGGEVAPTDVTVPSDLTLTDVGLQTSRGNKIIDSEAEDLGLTVDRELSTIDSTFEDIGFSLDREDLVIDSTAEDLGLVVDRESLTTDIDAEDIGLTVDRETTTIDSTFEDVGLTIAERPGGVTISTGTSYPMSFGIHSLMWDGSNLWSAGTDGKVRKHNMDSSLSTAQEWNASATGIDFDGTYIWTINNNTVTQWDSSFNFIQNYNLSGISSSDKIGAAGGKLWTSSNSSEDIREHNIDTTLSVNNTYQRPTHERVWDLHGVSNNLYILSVELNRISPNVGGIISYWDVVTSPGKDKRFWIMEGTGTQTAIRAFTFKDDTSGFIYHYPSQTIFEFTVYDNVGFMRENVAMDTILPNGRVSLGSISTDGTNFYIGAGNTNNRKIVKVDENFNFLAETTGTRYVFSLVWAQGKVYVWDYVFGVILQFSDSTLAYEDSFTVPGHSGELRLVYDGTYLWSADTTTLRKHNIDATLSVAESFPLDFGALDGSDLMDLVYYDGDLYGAFGQSLNHNSHSLYKLNVDSTVTLGPLVAPCLDNSAFTVKGDTWYMMGTLQSNVESYVGVYGIDSYNNALYSHAAKTLDICPPDIGTRIDEYRVTIPTLQTSQDTWVGDTVACADDNSNHNGENLSVEGTVSTAKKALLEFDLTNFPSSNVTVTSASVWLTVASIPATSQTVELFTIPAADEGWDETTVTCSTKPDEDVSASNTVVTVPGTVAGGSPGDLIEFPLDTAAAKAVIADRMGSGKFSVYVTGASLAGLFMTFYSSENGAAGQVPYLSLEYTVNPT